MRNIIIAGVALVGVAVVIAVVAGKCPAKCGKCCGKRGKGVWAETTDTVA